MNSFQYTGQSESCAGLNKEERNQDRWSVLNLADRMIVALADGAGGFGDGKRSALTLVRMVEENFKRMNNSNDWVLFLRQADFQINDGETTAVVLDIRDYGIGGASVGDSQVWIYSDDEPIHLTSGQIRKPLLGSSESNPQPIRSGPLRNGVLLVGSDGFFNYTRLANFQSILTSGDFYSIPRKCIDRVRLPSGDLIDDTTVVAIRRKPMKSSKRIFEI